MQKLPVIEGVAKEAAEGKRGPLLSISLKPS